MKKFFILWSPQSNLPPRKMLTTESEALQVAEFMAIRWPAQEFFVMEAKTRVKAVRVLKEALS